MNGTSARKPLPFEFDYRTAASLRYSAREYFLSRGLERQAGEEYKLRLLALVLRDGHIDEQNIARTGVMSARAFANSRQVLSSLGILREEHIPGGRRFIFAGDSALPALSSHYLVPGCCWVPVAAYDLRVDKKTKAQRPVRYEVATVGKGALVLRPEGRGKGVRVPLDSAFRNYARLKRIPS